MYTLNAQDMEKTAVIDHHEHHRHEVGIANSAVFFLNEKEFSYGLHAHYIHNFPETRLGIGVGYERIFDEHKHNSLGVVLSYRPVNKLSLSVTPGFAFEGSGSGDLNFALHLETLYEFQIEDMHVGPLLEFASDSEDVHFSAGVHIGLGF